MMLVAGVGYLYMRDLSFGPALVDQLRQEPWAGEAGIQIEDLSYGPIAVVQWFEDEPGRFERAIFAGAVQRGREPGSLTVYPWSSGAVTPETVQQRVVEAVTGVISLENLLMIADHFGVLPADSLVIELEPLDLEWGDGLSEIARRQLDEAEAFIQRHVAAVQRIN
jgi:hydrogenase maturation protease